MDEKLEHIETVAVADFRKDVAHFTEEAASKGKRIGITRHGRPVAAIVPISDVEVLESMDAAAYAKPERTAPEELSTGEQDLLQAILCVQQENPRHETSLPLAHSNAGFGLSPGSTLCAVVADQLGSYLTGQIAARIADSHILPDPDKFGSIQNIVARTINESFDSSILPNPPKEIFGPITKTSAPKKAATG